MSSSKVLLGDDDWRFPVGAPVGVVFKARYDGKLQDLTGATIRSATRPRGDSVPAADVVGELLDSEVVDGQTVILRGKVDYGDTSDWDAGWYEADIWIEFPDGTPLVSDEFEFLMYKSITGPPSG